MPQIVRADASRIEDGRPLRAALREHHGFRTDPMILRKQL